jgi:large subunit ribosomal protein L24
MSLAKMTPGQKKGIPHRIRLRKNDVLVEHCGMVKRHTKPNPQKQIKGGIAEREAPIHVSNVMLLTSGGVPTRIGTKVETQGKKTRRVRVARKSGEVLDKK